MNGGNSASQLGETTSPHKLSSVGMLVLLAGVECGLTFLCRLFIIGIKSEMFLRRGRLMG